MTQVLSETILQKAAEHLYGKYLQPKVMPYTAAQTMALTTKQVTVSATSQTNLISSDRSTSWNTTSTRLCAGARDRFSTSGTIAKSQ